MRMTKKILACALSVLMAVSIMPFTVFASDLPPATMTEIDVNNLPGDTTELGALPEIAYKFEATQSEEDFNASDYKNHIADFVISFDHDVPANTVYLSGSYQHYQNGKWVEFTSDEAIPAGTEIHLLQTVLKNMGYDSNFTYSDVYELVKTFYCGARGLDNAGTTMNVALNLYESEPDGNGGYKIKENAQPITLKEEDYTFGVPSAKITEVDYDTLPGEKQLDSVDVAYKYEAIDTAEEAANSPYAKYVADFTIFFDQDIEAGDVILTGAYQAYTNVHPYTWVNIELPAMQAGEKLNLLETFLKDAGYDTGITYEDACTTIREFYCAAKGLNASGAKINVALNLYESVQDPETGAYSIKEGAEPIVVESAEYTFDDDTLPQATITEVNYATLPGTKTQETVDVAYKYEAVDTAEEAANSKYANYVADFTISFDRDIEAGDVILTGAYQAYTNANPYTWVDIEVPAMQAGEKLNLLENVLKSQGYDTGITYADACSLIREFYCAAKGLDAVGTTVNVALNVYESVKDPETGAYSIKEGAEPITVAAEEYTFEEAKDKLSITVADKMDLNFYIANADGAAKVRYTYNSTPEEERERRETVTKNVSELPVVDGKFKVSIELAPAQAADRIEFEVLDAQGEPINGRTYNTSIVDYCFYLIENSNDAKVVKLAKATYDYAMSAARYFDYNYNEDAYPQGLFFEDADFSVYNFAQPDSDIAIETVAFRAVSVPELRFYVTGITEEEAAALTATTDKGYPASFVKVNDKIVLQVTGIPAAKLGEEITITLSNGDKVKYTPIIWAYKAAEINGLIAQLGNALANYNQAAKAYFG